MWRHPFVVEISSSPMSERYLFESPFCGVAKTQTRRESFIRRLRNRSGFLCDYAPCAGTEQQTAKLKARRGKVSEMLLAHGEDKGISVDIRRRIRTFSSEGQRQHRCYVKNYSHGKQQYSAPAAQLRLAS